MYTFFRCSSSPSPAPCSNDSQSFCSTRFIDLATKLWLRRKLSARLWWTRRREASVIQFCTPSAPSWFARSTSFCGDGNWKFSLALKDVFKFRSDNDFNHFVTISGTSPLPPELQRLMWFLMEFAKNERCTRRRCENWNLPTSMLRFIAFWLNFLVGILQEKFFSFFDEHRNRENRWFGCRVDYGRHEAVTRNARRFLMIFNTNRPENQQRTMSLLDANLRERLHYSLRLSTR